MTQQKTTRNQSMECAKMIASILVVLMHMELPGNGTPLVVSFSCFAVPMFFAISGYFSFGASCKTTARRLKHIFQLILIADLLNLICMSVLIELDGGSTIAYWRAAVPDVDELILWITVQHDSFLAQLWTMISTAICYALLWVYTRFFLDKPVKYQPLYLMGLVLFQFYAVMEFILPLVGIEIPYLAFRNAWFYGIPCFVLGMFLHEYQERIFRILPQSPWKLAAAFAGCIALYMLGFRIILPVEVTALMLLLLSAPKLPCQRPWVQSLISKFGIWSTAIYLIHITMLWVYESLFQSALLHRFGEGEIWIRPFAVVLMSFAGAVIWERADSLIRRWKRRKNA